MQAICKNGSYTLLQADGQPAGQLIREGYFSCKTHIKTSEDRIEFIKDGLFAPLKINRNGLDIGNLKWGWTGAHIKMDWGNRIKHYKICKKGIWNSGFRLIDEYKNELISIEPKFKWKKFNYDYQINLKTDHSEKVNTSLILMALYSVKKMMDRQYTYS